MTTPMLIGEKQLTGEMIESLVMRGDISQLNPKQKAAYYVQLCERVGLDPATQPFRPLTLQGKTIFYADKGCAEQLRKLHKISIKIVGRERIEDVYFVTAAATMPDGRTDESQGAVSIANLKGESLANAVMKAETKAKRRVTLSIVGLSMIDESELETVGAEKFGVLVAHQEAENASQAQPAEAAKEQLITPPPPDVLTEVPEWLEKRIPQLKELSTLQFKDMTLPDLELLKDAIQEKRASLKTDRGRQWATALEMEATLRIKNTIDGEAAQ